MRRPRRVYEVGHEPDPRFTLANERTLLAWLRTALALVVAGAAIVALSELSASNPLVETLAVIAFVSGGATAAIGYLHWQHTERAMRQDEPLPAGNGVVVVMVAIFAITLVGVLILLGVGG